MIPCKKRRSRILESYLKTWVAGTKNLTMFRELAKPRVIITHRQVIIEAPMEEM